MTITRKPGGVADLDKYEYRLKLGELKKLVEHEQYQDAAVLADDINWNRVRSVSTLCMVGTIYEKLGRYEDARDAFLLAYDRSPVSKSALYHLTKLAIRRRDVEEAEEFYQEFIQNAPNDRMRYIFAYQIAELKHAPASEKIKILEQLKQKEYTEKWAYELARLYYEAGRYEECADACDELALWFGDGEYVRKALELKSTFRPLSVSQDEQLKKILHKDALQEDDADLDEAASEEETVEETDKEESEEENLTEAEQEPETIQEMGSEKSYREVLEEMSRKQPDQETSDSDQKTDPEETVTETMDFSEVEEIPEDAQTDAKASEEEEIVFSEDGLEMPETSQKDAEEPEISNEETYSGAKEASSEEMAKTAVYGKERLCRELQKALDSIQKAEDEDELARISDRVRRMTADLPDYRMESDEGEILKQEQINQQVDQKLKQDFDSHLARENEKAQEKEEPEEKADDPEDETAGARRSIASVLASWEKTRKAARAAIQEARQNKLELTRQQAKEEVRRALSYLDTLPDPEETEAESIQPEKEVSDVNLSPSDEAEDSVTSGQNAGESDTEEALTEDFSEASEVTEETVPDKEAPVADFSEVTEDSVSDEEPVTADFSEVTEESSLDKEPLAEDFSEVPEEPSVSSEEKTQTEDTDEPVYDILIDRNRVRKKHQTQNHGENREEKTEKTQIKIPEKKRIKAPEKTQKTQEKSEKKPDKSTASRKQQKALEHYVTQAAGIMKENVPGPDQMTEAGQTHSEPQEDAAAVLSEEKQKKPDDLTAEQKKKLGYFLLVPGLKEQISHVLHMQTEVLSDTKTSASGNILIEGSRGSGKSSLACRMIRIIQDSRPEKEGMFKIHGAAVNRRPFESIASKTGGGFLIIEEAGKLTEETARRMSEVMGKKTGGLLIILEDTPENLNRVLQMDSGFAARFTEKIRIPELSADQLIDFAGDYAASLKHSIDEMGKVALREKIMEVRAEHAVTIQDIRQMVDTAVSHTSDVDRRHFGTLFDEKYDANHNLILHAHDFT